MVYAAHLKRPFDIAASAALIVLAAPIVAPLACINAVLLNENPFISVERVGKDGEPFRMFKIKTMRTAFDELGHPLPDWQRRTGFGKLLRKTSLDELPQLFNVFSGDMSMVGPRPGDQNLARGYIPTVRPGLAGPWQVAVIGAKNPSTFEERNQLDASYVTDGITFKKDIMYLLKALRSPFRGHDGETWHNISL